MSSSTQLCTVLDIMRGVADAQNSRRLTRFFLVCSICFRCRIYKNKIRSIRTAGGHHRIPGSEVDKLLFRTRGKTEKERADVVRRVSGRNQLVGRIDSVRISGLMAEVKISIGNQHITSIITASSAREMQLKPDRLRLPSSKPPKS